MTDQIDMIYLKRKLFSIDSFDINQNIIIFYINVDLISHFDFLATISLFGLSVLLFILRLSSITKFWHNLRNDSPSIYKKAILRRWFGYKPKYKKIFK